ncbi:MAG: aldehyde ferredoxin oxidoreductase, partial [Delftia sp.]|nr:aldehyde ferredoxin oxidoreductase [Delftia sp.]
LTGGIKESNAGGASAAKLARIGLAGVIIEGQPADDGWYVLSLTANSAELLAADELKGLGTYALVRELRQKHSPAAAILCIGPAGEQQLHSASIQVTDLDGNPCRAAGRGGLGALMGAKGLKAIIIDDRDGAAPAIADPKLFKAGQKKIAEAIRAHPVSGEAMPALGTAMVVGPMNAVGAFPTRNCRSGTYAQWEKISGEALAERITERGGQTTHTG